MIRLTDVCSFIGGLAGVIGGVTTGVFLHYGWWTAGTAIAGFLVGAYLGVWIGHLLTIRICRIESDRRLKSKPNQASDATSEPAPSAGSSSHQR